MTTTATVCIFKRKKNSKTERGIMIGGDKIIIDKNFKPVKTIPPIWSYSLLWHEGTLQVEL